tara:strand:+ start:210 stop:410 length:201 start_codon:yes stop_codon:yes gene_type:complete
MSRKKKYKIYFDYSQWGIYESEYRKVYQGTTDDLDAWIKNNNSHIEDPLFQPETLEDYIIEEVNDE